MSKDYFRRGFFTFSIFQKIKRFAAVLAIPVFVTPYAVAPAPVAESATVADTTALISSYIASRNSSLSYDEVMTISNAVVYYSSMYGVDPLLITALLETESNFNQSDVSDAGAIGIGQLMPDTALALGVNPYDTVQNIQGACSYLSNAYRTFSDWPDSTALALAAYNAGTQAVINYGGIPPYSETQNYVIRIRDRYFNLRAMLGESIVTYDQPQYDGSNGSYAASGSNGDYIEYTEQDPPTMEIQDAEDY